MREQYSAIIGMVGGLVDLIAGLALLQPQLTMMRRLFVAILMGYFLLALGTIVFVTALYILTAHMITKSLLVGRLMLVYGVIMLVLGFGMLTHLFPMMQGADLSGLAMLATGVAMLYSGFDMVRM